MPSSWNRHPGTAAELSQENALLPLGGMNKIEEGRKKEFGSVQAKLMRYLSLSLCNQPRR